MVCPKYINNVNQASRSYRACKLVFFTGRRLSTPSMGIEATALIWLGLALYHPTASVSSISIVLYT